MLKDWKKEYLANPDGFLNCIDWMMDQPEISEAAKNEVREKFVETLLKPAQILRIIATNPATLIAQGAQL